MGEPREALRPGHLAMVAGKLWVFDRLQPTAVVLDPDSEAVLDLPSWQQVLPSLKRYANDPDGEWRIHCDDRGVWVQQRTGPIAAIDDRGLAEAFYSAGLTATALSAHGLWCLPTRPRPDLADRPDAPVRFRGNQSMLRLIPSGDGAARTICLDTAVVHAARAVDGDLYLHIEEPGGSRAALGSGSWIYRPVLRWARLPAGHPVPDHLKRTDLADATEPPQRLSARNAGRIWSPHPTYRRPQSEPAGGRSWRVALDAARLDTGQYARAWTTDTDAAGDRLDVDLGPGTPIAALGTADSLWVAIEQPRLSNIFARPKPTALVRIDAATGTHQTMLAPGSVDITTQSWPLGPAPIDADDYARFYRDQLALTMNGPFQPLAAGVHAGRADLAGSWPDTSVHLTFDLDSRPGTRLRRIVPLYDELGRPTPPDHAISNLWEEIETRQLPQPLRRTNTSPTFDPNRHRTQCIDHRRGREPPSTGTRLSPCGELATPR